MKRYPNAIIAAWVVSVIFALGYSASAYRQGSQLSAGVEWERLRGARSQPSVVPGEREALANVRNTGSLALGAAALLAIDQAESLVLRWDAEVVPLLSNDAGRSIAAAPELVRSFRKTWDARPKQGENFAAARTVVKRLMEPIRSAIDDNANTATASEDTAKLLVAERAKAENIAKNYAKPLEEVRILRARAEALSLGPSDLTLREAVEKQRFEEHALAAIKRETDEEIARMKAESPEYQRLYGPSAPGAAR